ncbi:MAG: GxxExxY protein [Bacteroidota bacterium]
MITENEIARIVVNICFKIHTQYGPGLFESVYEEIFCYELAKTGLFFTRQQAIPLIHDGVKMGTGFRADVIIENKVIVELKSIELLAPLHFKQIRSYLILTDCKLGILVNFNVELIKDGIHRIVNKL